MPSSLHTDWDLEPYNPSSYGFTFPPGMDKETSVPRGGLRYPSGAYWYVFESSLQSQYLQHVAERLTESTWRTQAEDELRDYGVPVADAFRAAQREYPSIGVDPAIMAGAPCVRGTRIPVYMILDAIEYYGSLEAVQRSYPSVTLDQIKDAIGFAKVVVECP